MSSKVKVTKTVQNEGILITAEVVSGTLPKDIFVYTNTGTSSLGEFQGVVNFNQYNSFQVWKGEPIAVFGNKYIRYSQAKILVSNGKDPNSVITGIVNSIKTLDSDLQAKGTTTEVYTI